MSWQGRGADPTGSVLLHDEDRIGVSDAVQGQTFRTDGAVAGGCEKCGLSHKGTGALEKAAAPHAGFVIGKHEKPGKVAVSSRQRDGQIEAASAVQGAS